MYIGSGNRLPSNDPSARYKKIQSLITGLINNQGFNRFFSLSPGDGERSSGTDLPLRARIANTTG